MGAKSNRESEENYKGEGDHGKTTNQRPVHQSRAGDKDGNLVGRGDFRAQVKQVFENLKARLEEGGASFKDVVKLNYYLTDASDLQALRDTRNSYINTENPPASTLVVVKQLVREEYLVEIEAVAVVGE